MLSIIFFFIALFIFAQLGGVFGNSGYQKQARMSFAEAKILIALTAKVAKSDGHVNEAEAAMMSEILDDLVRKIGGGESEREALKLVYKVEKERVDNTLDLARQFNAAFRPSSSRKTALIYFFLNLAYIDRSFTVGEKDIITQICVGFDIPPHIQSQIFAMFEASFYGRYGEYSQGKQSGGYGRSQGGGYYGSRDGYSNGESYGNNGYGGGSSRSSVSSKKDPYDVLDVEQNASFSEIKKKYRELVKKYHPDILMGNGADDEIVQDGTRKLQEINEAYESLKKKFGEK